MDSGAGKGAGGGVQEKGVIRGGNGQGEGGEEGQEEEERNKMVQGTTQCHDFITVITVILSYISIVNM